ncbi:hypothetical protein E4U23_005045 [Claviceps purpurea]|nr:hypothetical protein E4U23_005045 [Claviceps purpurea]
MQMRNINKAGMTITKAQFQTQTLKQMYHHDVFTGFLMRTDFSASSWTAEGSTAANQTVKACVNFLKRLLAVSSCHAYFAPSPRGRRTVSTGLTGGATAELYAGLLLHSPVVEYDILE